LDDVQLTQKDVYITNVVKCYLKPGIRLEDKWIDSCFPYLINQIGFIKPKVVVGLGADAGRALLNKSKNVSLGSMRDKRYKLTDETSIVITYHPSYFLRAGGKKHKHYYKIIEDLNWVKEIVNR
jgi:uracil-DNA glycosylase family 4